MDYTHPFPFISGVLEEALGDEHLAEAGMLFPETYFHGSEMEAVWSLFVIVWYPVDFTGMNQYIGISECYPEKSGQSSLWIKNEGLEYILCCPAGGGLSVEAPESAPRWAFFPQRQGNVAGKWENLLVRTSNLPLFIG